MVQNVAFRYGPDKVSLHTLYLLYRYACLLYNIHINQLILYVLWIMIVVRQLVGTCSIIFWLVDSLYMIVNVCIKYYCIAGKFGEYLNLAIW